MNSIEDRVRAAAQAEASSLREVRPLRLPPDASPRRAPRSRLAARRTLGWRGWLLPVTAAAVVVAFAIALVTIRDLPNGPTAPPSVPPTNSGVPPYYVTLYNPPQSSPTPTATGSGQPAGAPCPAGAPGCPAAAATELLVGDTLTGARLATIAPPNGADFYGVTGAANDRTFVVDTYHSGSVSDFALPRTFYRLQIVPGAKSPVRLTRLPLPSMTGMFAMALSESGTELAVARMSSKANDQETWLQIYSVDTGRLLRSWSTDNGYVFDRGADVMSDSNYGLAWVDGDRAVDFPYNYESRGAPTTIKFRGRTVRDTPIIRHLAVRTVDVTASGGDLITDSRVLWSVVIPETGGYSSGTCGQYQDALVSADGKTVLCVSTYGPDTYRPASKIVPWHLEWQAFSVTAPKTARIVYGFTVDAPIASSFWLNALWSNASGSAVIGFWYSGSGTTKPVHFGVMSDGSFRAFPVPPSVVAGGPVTIAW